MYRIQKEGRKGGRKGGKGDGLPEWISLTLSHQEGSRTEALAEGRRYGCHFHKTQPRRAGQIAGEWID
jgi:hypothetical protein